MPCFKLFVSLKRTVSGRSVCPGGTGGRKVCNRGWFRGMLGGGRSGSGIIPNLGGAMMRGGCVSRGGCVGRGKRAKLLQEGVLST